MPVSPGQLTCKKGQGCPHYYAPRDAGKILWDTTLRVADLGRVNVPSVGQLPVFACPNSNDSCWVEGHQHTFSGVLSTPLSTAHKPRPSGQSRDTPCLAYPTGFERSFGHEFSLSLPQITSHRSLSPAFPSPPSVLYARCASGLQSEKDQIRQESWHRWQASRQTVASDLAWFESASQNYVFLV